MERDEAIAILRKEYLCVDRDCGIEKGCGMCDLVMPSKEPILEAFKMAIKALEQESVLDKIRAEINSPNRGTCDYFIVDRIEGIINKYMAEKE